MKIFNAMFSKKLGGLEQAFLDYNHALLMQHNDVISIIHPSALVENNISNHYIPIKNFNSYDILAISKLKKLVINHRPNCIITHGRRAFSLFKKTNLDTILIGVSHKYNSNSEASYSYLKGADAVIAITKYMRQELIGQGFRDKDVYYVPNMISIPDNITYESPKFRDVPVIGMIGRLAHEKGYDIFIKALSTLKKQGIEFSAKIAGDGEDYNAIVKYIDAEGLKSDIEMSGWIEDTASFYKGVDIICVPSYIESFGIVLLEALLHSKPCIASLCPGPKEIGEHEKNLLLFPIGDHNTLADMIRRLINDKQLAENITKAGFSRALQFSSFNVSRILQDTIEDIYFRKKG
jgi:glycosyltransferase involved in cell wall biosynthesis